MTPCYYVKLEGQNLQIEELIDLLNNEYGIQPDNDSGIYSNKKHEFSFKTEKPIHALVRMVDRLNGPYYHKGIYVYFSNGISAYAFPYGRGIFAEGTNSYFFNGPKELFEELDSMNKGTEDFSNTTLLEVEPFKEDAQYYDEDFDELMNQKSEAWSPDNIDSKNSDIVEQSRRHFKSFWEAKDARIENNLNETMDIISKLQKCPVVPTFVVCDLYEIEKDEVLAKGKVVVNSGEVSYITPLKRDMPEHLIALHMHRENTLIVSAESFISLT